MAGNVSTSVTVMKGQASIGKDGAPVAESWPKLVGDILPVSVFGKLEMTRARTKRWPMLGGEGASPGRGV